MTTVRTAPQVPKDYKDRIIALKQEMRDRIGDVEGLFHQVCHKIEGELAAARRDEQTQGSAWPEISWAALAAGEITTQQIDQIKRRGCVVVRQTFARETALEMDQSILHYLDINHFDDIYRGPGDNFFGTLEASRPEIYPIYWSKAQMEARQSQEISVIQSFLNRLWKFEHAQGKWFDPDINVIYPDRIRRRLPGTTSKGLGAHTDSGALERWLLPTYQRIFSQIWNNRFEDYDAWDAAFRPEVHEYAAENTTKCSAFRTFQGWTALSDMSLGQGLLHAVPVPEAMAYILLRPLLKDVPEDELCGVAPGRVLPVSERWHPHLMKGLCSLPTIQAGDSVWWHCDLIHSVAPVVNQQGWSNVMYIPAAPLCEKNRAYADKVRQALETGASPADFPRENYEENWRERFLMSDLNSTGRKSLGIEAS